MSKNYKVVAIIGDFEGLVGKVLAATSEEDVKEQIKEYLRENIDKYLYPVVDEIKED